MYPFNSKRLLLTLLVLALPVAFLYPTASASATYYQYQRFCYNVYLAPGARCVGYENPRISQLFAWTPEWGAEICVVGKETNTGGGGNRYPVACDTDGQVTGPVRTEGEAEIGWPTIINRSSVTVFIEGTWNGWFP
jgi:hypothetical protein